MGIEILIARRAAGSTTRGIAAGRRGDPAGVRRDDRRLRDAARPRLRDGGHDVRLGAQRVEARRELRARRVHVAHPRQVLPRGDARHGVAGGEVSRGHLPRRAQHGRGAATCATTSRARDDRATRSSTKFAQAGAPDFDPDLHLQRIGVANQTTMLARESLAIGEEVGAAMARALRRRVPRDALPHLRHDLQRHAGPAGRGERAAARAARRDARDRRLQLEQHDLARRALRRARAHVPRGGRARASIRSAARSATCRRARRTKSRRRDGCRSRRRCASASPPARARRTTRSARRWRACFATRGIDPATVG